jgi:GTP cyclohydrolase FolE2
MKATITVSQTHKERSTFNEKIDMTIDLASKKKLGIHIVHRKW